MNRALGVFSNAKRVNMKLYLHTPELEAELNKIYKEAFHSAVELFVVTAYLTDWDSSLELNKRCKNFRLIVGKDFGITRKEACKKVMKWLPSNRKSQFLVADEISGFHPKAAFWKSIDNNYYSIIGSSNLTKAAFDSNYEANIYSEISEKEYINAKDWVKEIEKYSVVMSEAWLERYKEGINSPKKGNSRGKKHLSAVIKLKLPVPKGAKAQVLRRRKQLKSYEKYKNKLVNLFRRCVSRQITSEEFYEELPNIWGYEFNNRLQGSGWERKGKGSNFRELSQSFLNIYDAPRSDRDDVVAEEIDRLKNIKVVTRKAFLSEMLCLAFPSEYPVLNKPISDYLKDIAFSAPRGASEGSKYIDLAKKLRFSLLQNKKHPAKNLAELDTVIWLAYK